MKSTVSKKFPLPDGACLGHYDKAAQECGKCRFSRTCSGLKLDDVKGFFPANDEDVRRFVESIENADK